MRKIWILSALIMLIITLYQINSAYAKYYTEAKGTIEEQIGAWIVKVNGTNIATGTDLQEFTINELTYNSNDYVLEGKIAPGLLGYFDVEIDATEASVAVRYDVSINFEQLDLTDSIYFARLVKVVDGVESTEGITKTGESTYTGVVSLDDIQNKKTNTIRVYLGWDDDGTGVNDEADSELGLQKDIQISIPVEVKASQYLGENIEEYNP